MISVGAIGKAYVSEQPEIVRMLDHQSEVIE